MVRLISLLLGLTTIVVSFSLSSNAKQSEDLGEKPQEVLFYPLHSRVEITPHDRRQLMGNTTFNELNFLHIRELIGDVLWHNQDELGNNVYDRLSNISFSPTLLSMDLAANPGVHFGLDWDTTLRRRVYLSGPDVATDTIPYQYLELNGLSTRVRGSVGLSLPGFNPLEADVRLGVGMAFNYAKFTDLYMLQGIQLPENRAVKNHLDNELTQELEPFLSEEDQQKWVSEENQKRLAENISGFEKGFNKVLDYIEDKLAWVGDKFIDDDRGKAYITRLLDPLRLPAQLIKFNGKIKPISWEKVRRMPQGEMLFFNAYVEAGTSFRLRQASSSLGLAVPVSWAYHISVRKDKDDFASMKLQFLYNRNYEIPRAETGIKFKALFLTFDYDTFRFVFSKGKALSLEYIFRYNLSDPVAQRAFDDMLKLKPETSIEAVQNGEEGVSPLLAHRLTHSKNSGTNHILAIPELFEFKRTRLTSLSRIKAYPVPERGENNETKTGFENEIPLSDVVEGRTEIIRKKWSRIPKLEDDEQRQVVTEVETNLDLEGQLEEGDKYKADSEDHTEEDDPLIHQANVRLKLRYAWQDEVTSQKEFGVMKDFLNHLFSGSSDLINDPEVKRYMDREIPEDTRQAFVAELAFSHNAIGRILQKSSDQIWETVAARELGEGRLWKDKGARRKWRLWRRDQIYENGFEQDLVCPAMGFLFMLGEFPSCDNIYQRTRRLTEHFESIQNNESVESRIRSLNQVATIIGENPTLGHLLLQLNDGTQDVTYGACMAGAGLDKQACLSSSAPWEYRSMKYRRILASERDFRDKLKTIRYGEVYRDSRTEKIVLALETSRLIQPTDRLFVDLYRFKAILKDTLLRRYYVEGSLAPLSLTIPVDSADEDMTIRRYRYEINLPDDFLNQLEGWGDLKKDRFTLQYLFIDEGLRQSLTEAGEVSFVPERLFREDDK